MVLDYYNLREQPFGVTPDPKFLYASATHREALASLLYGLEEGRGFVALIARPGMGKTTLLFHALNQLKDKIRVAFVFQTICTQTGFLRAVLTDLGVHETEGNLVELQAKLNEVVTEQSRLGKPLVIIIDEAQNLDDSVLELARMLSNFETSRQKLIQIVFSGQPQLADKLASPELVQLRQRVSIFACLKPFSAIETALYVDHRMRLAGYKEGPLFSSGALATIAEWSQGIPRNINNLCFNAMSLGCALKRKTIDSDVVREVIADLDLGPLQERKSSSSPAMQKKILWVPAASVARARSMLKGGLPKLAAACAIGLALGAAIFHGHHRALPSTVVQAHGGGSPVAPAHLSSSNMERNQQLAALPGTIRVTPGETLDQICAEDFGSCNPERLQEIRRLNPWLTDPDHIETGQGIRVPVVEKSSVVKQRTFEQSNNASPAERGTQ